MFKISKLKIHYDIVRNSFNCTSLIKRSKAFSTWSKFYIHYYIVYNSSLLHANHALKSIAQGMEYQLNMESHCIEMCMRTIHSKDMVVIRTAMYMTTINSKRIWKVIRTECVWRKPIQKKWIVIRTEIYMTKTHSQGNG